MTKRPLTLPSLKHLVLAPDFGTQMDGQDGAIKLQDGQVQIKLQRLEIIRRSSPDRIQHRPSMDQVRRYSVMVGRVRCKHGEAVKNMRRHRNFLKADEEKKELTSCVRVGYNYVCFHVLFDGSGLSPSPIRLMYVV
jgi:hypothetical protein